MHILTLLVFDFTWMQRELEVKTQIAVGICCVLRYHSLAV